MAMLLPLVMALVPLLIAPGVLFYFDVTPKLAILFLGTAAALPFSRSVGNLWRQARWFCLLLAAQASSLLVSTLTSTRPELSLWGSTWRRFGLVTQITLLVWTLLVAAYAAEDPGAMRRLLRAMAVAGVPIALYGMFQYLGWDPWLPKQAYHIGEGEWTIVRPPSTLGYASYFANYLIYVAFAGAALVSAEKQRNWRALGAVAAGLACAGILLSGTRAAMLGLVAGVAFLRPRVSWRMVAAGAALLAAFYFSPPGRQLRSRARWYVEDARGGARLWLWRDSLRLLAAHAVTGSGLETFSSEFPRYQSPELARAFPDFYHESPHNMFVDAATSQGVAGLVVLLALTGMGLVRGRNGFVGAALAASVVSQQFTVFVLPTALCFFVMLALAAVPQPESRPLPHGRGPVFAMLPVAALLAFLAVRFIIGDYRLERVRQDLDRGDINAAIATYPGALGADLWYSRRLAAVAGVEAARAAFWAAKRATQTSDDPQNAWYSLAALYAARNDYAGTEQSLRSAIACAPKWFKPHWTLAQVLALQGRRAEARAEASLAADLDAGKNPEVVQTLKKLQE